MAEKKETKKTTSKTNKSIAKPVASKSKHKNYNEMSLKQLRTLLQKTTLQVRARRETDTSILSKIKKQIAINLTKDSLKLKNDKK